ncbi:hypothetical protein D3OALGA1CA_5263 [Olavius algarvensis associated proteobacterium Delta 3]|nr:hypothetical protein D3OALGA1CA_5263 [Olavius algarvensis associated proteobacterium Delta 3]
MAVAINMFRWKVGSGVWIRNGILATAIVPSFQINKDVSRCYFRHARPDRYPIRLRDAIRTRYLTGYNRK